MERIDNGSQAASKPAVPSASGTPGYYTDGNPPTTSPTEVNAYHLNFIQEEIANAIEEFGVTLDRADDGQLAAVLAARIKGILGAASDTGSVSTTHLRAIITSATSQSSGARSLVAASDTGVASGGNSAVIACDTYAASSLQTAAIASDGSAGSYAVAGTNNAVIGGINCSTSANASETVILGSTLGESSPATAKSHSVVAASHLATAEGDQTAVIASKGALGGPVAVIANGINAAVLASTVTSTATTASGTQALIGAADDCTITGGTEGAILAATGSTMNTGANMAVIAASGCDNRGASQTAMIGSTGCFVSTSSNAVLLGSANAEAYNRTNGFGGGYSGSGISYTGADQNLTVWFDTSAGTGKATSGFSTGTADFAEYMRIADYIEPGRLVALYQHGGEMLCEPAQPGDDVVGIISAAPAFLGNDDELTSADGLRRKDLPNEWGIVAMMGQLPLTVDETVGVGDYIEAGTDGIGTRSELRTNIRVLKKLGTDVAQVLIR